MVAIVTGSGLGLQRDSAAALGVQGQLGTASLGQAAGKVTVNAANGNLVIQSRDEMLIGLGLDDVVANTYNSQGTFTSNGWQESFQRHVGGLAGTINAAGSTITHYAADGSAIVYSYNGTVYVGNELGGAYDTLSFNASSNQWTWQDGKSRASEVYDNANGGRLVSSSDASGNSLSYSYTGSQLTKITTAGGDYTSFSYTGALLTSVVTSYTNASGLQTETRVRYGYDGSGRLTTVTTDLSPSDNSVSDGNTYVTTYGYDGTSDRVNAIAQSDGTSLAITYTQVNGAYAVASYTQTVASGVSQTTRFSYGANRTTVTDPQGNATTLVYDGNGQLTQLISPAAQPGGALRIQVFNYDANGNLLYSGPAGDPNFANIAQNWGNLWTSTAAITLQSTETDGGVAVYRRQTTTTPASGWAMNMGQTGAALETVVPGQSVWASAYAASSGASELDFWASWYNASGAYIGSSLVSKITPGGTLGSSGVATANFGSGFVTAPAGAASVGLTVQAIADGTGPLNVAIAQPKIAMVTAAGDANFTNIAQNWGNTWTSGGTVSATSSTETDGGVAVYRRQTTTTPASGWAMNMGQTGAALETVVPGQSVWASAYAASSGASELDFLASWYNASGGYIGGSLVSKITPGGTLGSSGVATANYGSGFVTAPAGAASVGLTVQAIADGTGPLNVAIAQPKIAMVTAADDADFSHVVQNWGNTWTSDNTPSTAQTTEVDDGVRVYRRQTMTTPASGWAMNMGQTGAALETVVPGQTIWASAYAASSGASELDFWASWYNASGAYIGSSLVSKITPGGTLGSSGVATANYGSGFVTAPAGAASVGLTVQAIADGTGPLNVAIAQPTVEIAGAAADADFTNIAQNWGNTWTSGGTVSATSSTETDGGVAVYRRQTTTTPASGWAMNMGQTAALETVVPGQAVWAGAYAASSGASELDFLASWYNASGGYIGGSLVSKITPGGTLGSSGVATANYGSGFVTAPAGAASVGLMVQAIADGTGPLNVAIAQPTLLIGGAASNASIPAYVYTYDANGNPMSKTDALGNQTTYSYDGNNQLLMKTEGANSATPLVTRYVYDGLSRLVYTVSARGDVTRYVYNSQGEQTSVIQYTGALYTASGNPAQSMMDAWSSGSNIDLTQTRRTDTTYDARGQLASVTTYAQTDSNGNGIASTASVTTYVYDQSGNLLSRQMPGSTAVETYVYDGLGRVISSSDVNGKTTSTVYSNTASGLRVTVTLANGTVKTSTYDLAGELISVTTSGSGLTATTTYAYDADGNLIKTTDPTGLSSDFVYDAEGRKVADVAADGTIVAYAYNAAGQVVSATHYANKLSSAQLSLLSGETAASGLLLLSAVTPPPSTSDRWGFNLYDADGRLAETIDPIGAVTAYSYDALGRLVATTNYATLLSASTLAGFETAAPTSVVLPTANAASDRTTRTFYNTDDQVTGQLDADGYLTQIVYDASGRKIQTIAYATQTNSADWAGGTFAQLLSDAGSSSNDIYHWWVYDGQGHLRADIDGVGNITRYDNYTAAGNAGTVTAGQVVNVSSLIGATPPTYASLSSLSATGTPEVTSFTYDLYGHVLTKTLTLTGGATQTTTYTYDAVYNLVSQATQSSSSATGGADGRTDLIQYDGLGRKSAELSGQGAAALSALGANPTQAQVNAVWSQYQTTYSYDAAGRLIAQTDADGHRALFYYDADGRLTYSVDPAGDVTQYGYDTFGEKTDVTRYATAISASTLSSLSGGQITSALTGAITTSTGDSHGHVDDNADGTVADTVDALGATTRFSYDAFGDMTSEVDPLSSGVTTTTNKAYSRRGLLMSSTADAGGLAPVTSYQYDAFGRVTQVTDAAGNATKTTYDRAGEVLTRVDALNDTTSYSYDGFGHVLSMIDPTGAKTSYAYSLFDRQVTVTDPKSIVTTTTKNAYGQTVKVVDGAGVATTYAYDADGNLISTTDGNGNLTQKTYDAADRLVATTDAAGYVTGYAYDAEGRVTQQTRYPSGVSANALPANPPAGSQVTTMTYDGEGRLVSVTDPLGVETYNTYDGDGRKTSSTVAYGTSDAAKTQWTYDAGGRMLSRTEAAGTTAASTVSFTYDALGRKLTETDGNSHVTSWTYDNDGRVLTKTDAAGGVTKNQYDAQGNLVAVTDPNGNTGYFYYDGMGRQILQVDAQGYATQTSYDLDGQVSSVRRYFTPVNVNGVSATPPALTTSPSDNTTSFTRDNDGRVLTRTDGVGNVTTYTYDGMGNRTSMTNALGGTTTWTYDARGLMLTQATPASSVLNGSTPIAPASTTAYTYDAFGNRTRMLEAQGRTEQRTTNYAYDAGNRLIQQTGDTVTVTSISGATSSVVPTQSFAYDNRGNRIKATDGLGNTTYTYYDLNDRKVAQVDALGYLTTWSYDGNGNVLSQTQYATVLSGPFTAGGTAPTAATSTSDRTESYAYDADNRQTSVSVKTAEAGSWNTASGAWTSATGALTTNTTYDADGNVTKTTDGLGNAAYVYYDKLGRKIASVDQAGYLTSYTLDAEGNVTSQTQYATALSGPFTAGGSPPAAPAGSSNDRTTSFTYDHDGQRLSEARSNASVASISGDKVSSATQSATVTFTYNALGQVTSKTEATDDKTAYAYDTMGRLAQVTTASGATNAMMTETTYDGLGNVLTTVAGYGTTYAETTTYAYGAGGRLATKTDAAGFVTTYGYDAKGQVTVQSYSRAKSDGTSVQEATLNSYDALGHVTSTAKATWNGSAWVGGDTSDSFYDAFAEVVASGVNTGGSVSKAQTFSDYDTAGRVWRTNAGDGVVKVYGYDANGNQTLEIESQGSTDLRTVSNLDAAVKATGTSKTYNLYDSRNELVDVKRPVSVNLDGTIGSGGNAVIDTSGQVVVSSTVAGGPWGGNTTATFNVAINSPEVTADNGTGQIHVLVSSDDSAVANQSATFASGTMDCGTYSLAFANGPQPGPGSGNVQPPTYHVTVQVYQDVGSGTIQLAAPQSFVVVCQPSNPVSQSIPSQVGRSLKASVPNATSMTMYVRTAGSTGGYTVIAASQAYDIHSTPIPGEYFVDLTKTPFNNTAGSSWDVIYVAKSASGQVLDAKEGTVTFDTNNPTNPTATSFASVATFLPAQNSDGTWTLSANAAAISLSDSTQAFDAFGDVTSQTDANGNTTNYTYDVLGDLTQKIAPQVTAVDETGVGSLVTPTDTYYYDASGRLVGHKDANSNLTTQSLLAGTGYDGSNALVTVQYDPDQGKVQTGYDIFGNAITQTDAMVSVTTNSYDLDNRLISVKHPDRGSSDSYTSGSVTQLIDYYSYDGLGQRIKHTNNVLSSTETTDYDVEGRVTKTASFGGETTSYGYSWTAATATTRVTKGQTSGGYFTKTTTNVAGKTSTAATDTFGTITASSDFGGHSFSYSYNLAGELTSQTSSATGQSLSYVYTSSGQIANVTDGATGIVEVFAYDKAGNRTVEGYYRTGSTPGDYQNSVISYDALNRVSEIHDINADITYSYDANGNRREVKSVYVNVNRLGSTGYVASGAGGASQTQDYWYKYDSMNRFVLTEGSMVNGAITTTSTAGVSITYDARGDRMSATYGHDNHAETYAYGADGYLETVKIGGVLNASRTTDVLGRMTGYTEYQTDGTTVLSTRGISYDGDSRVTKETDMTYATVNGSSVTYTSQITNSYTSSGVDQGVITGSTNVQTQSGSSSTVTTTTSYSYVWWNQAKQSATTVTGSDPSNPNAYNWPSGNASYSYDQNGNLTSVNDSGVNRVVTYQDDSFGQVLARKETDGGSTGVYRNFFYLNGQAVGDVGTDQLASTLDYAQQLSTDRTNAANAGQALYNITATPSVTLNANFDENYQADNSTTVGQAGSSYTVMSGDTLQSVAQNAWGDSSLWYLIADANGLSAGSTLSAGESLIIPDGVENLHNASGISKPYNPSDALSNTNVTLPQEPQPPAPSGTSSGHHGGCGVVGDVLATIVAVVVTAVVAPWAAGEVGGFLNAGAAAAVDTTTMAAASTAAATAGSMGLASGTAAMGAAAGATAAGIAGATAGASLAAEIAGGAIAGAIGGIAGQATEIGVGNQSRFNWSSVAMSAIAGGVGGGLGTAGRGFTAGLERGLASNAIGQGVDMAVGLQKSFSWTGLAVSGIAGGVGNEVGQWAGGGQAGAAVGGAAGALAGAATESALTGQDLGKSLRDVLPSAIGQTIGDMIAGSVEQQQAGNNYGNRTLDANGEEVIMAGSMTPAEAAQGQSYADAMAEAMSSAPTGYPSADVAGAGGLGAGKSIPNGATRYPLDRSAGVGTLQWVSGNRLNTLVTGDPNDIYSVNDNGGKSQHFYSVDDNGNIVSDLGSVVAGANGTYVLNDVDPATGLSRTFLRVGQYNNQQILKGGSVLVGFTDMVISDLNGADHAGTNINTPAERKLYNGLEALGAQATRYLNAIQASQSAAGRQNSEVTIAMLGRADGQLAGWAFQTHIINAVPKNYILGGEMVAGGFASPSPGTVRVGAPSPLEGTAGTEGAGAAEETEATPDVIAARRATAQAYYESTGWSADRIAAHMEGIDFSKPVEVVTLPAGTDVVQYQIPGNPTGRYFAPVGTSAESIGVDPTGRTATIYTTTEDVTVLRSSAADTSGNMNVPPAARGAGGGTQYFTTTTDPFKPKG